MPRTLHLQLSGTSHACTLTLSALSAARRQDEPLQHCGDALAGLRLSESIAEQHADDSDSESGIDAHQLPERCAIYSVLGHYGIESGIHGLGGIKLGVHDLGESLDLAQDIVPR